MAVTRDLVISASPNSDNLTPGETIGHDTPEVGTDGPELSCPGSSVEAEEYEENRE